MIYPDRSSRNLPAITALRRWQARWILIAGLFFIWNPIIASAETARLERTVRYQIDYQINPILKFITRHILHLKFLDWEELSFKEEWIKEGESERLAIFTVQPKDFPRPILYLKNCGEVTEGFGRLFSKENKFTQKNAVESLSALNKLYSDKEEDFEINAPNLFEEIEESQGNRGSMYCKITKKKDLKTGKHIITVITFNGNKQPNTRIEILFDPKEKVFESAIVKLKIPVRIALTRIF